tara:strand:+ start:85 stop:432 length:348 start_codon:yes stop_codon:yes gene_type:complete
MNLDPGYYKIKSRSRRAFNSFHYLRVFMEGKNKYVQIDDGVPQEANEEMAILLESYTLVKRITHHNPVEVNSAVMTISWDDEDSDPFQMKMRNIHNFKRTMNLFPRLKKALSFKE